ncbi:LysR family transcriptional regulator [Phytomonospora sp. NPDC050363]|uniref:LysR substrate-binding domain-containing protein n=1 Tax=Phytomonospora sp. NPDC050363 TaxID=3155642 RepID=UPI0033EB0910
MELELRHLRVLCAIADTGGLGRAAAAMGLSQPAMSTQLRRIERVFGEALFVRDSGGVRLTPYGLDVVERARDVLDRADALIRRPTGPPEGVTTLRLGSTTTPILPGLVARLRNALPAVSVTVSSVYGTDTLVEALEGGELDVALAMDYPGLDLRHSAAVAHRVVATEPAFVAMPADHPLAHRVEVSLAELAGDTWFVTPDDGAGWPGVFYAACREAGFTPPATHEFLGTDQTLAMIAARLGVTACQPTVRAVAGLNVKPLTGSPLWCRHILAWRVDGPGAALAAALHHHAVSVYRELIPRAPHFRAWLHRNRVAPTG